MSIRIDVTPDEIIEIMIPNGQHSKFLKYRSVETALIVIKYLIKREVELVRGARFVPQIEKEAREAFKTLSERSPWNDTKK